MSSMKINYTITTDSTLLDQQNAITPELRPKLKRFHHMALEGKASSIPKLKKAIEDYPDNPQLKNYLSVLYGKLNDLESMYEANRRLIAEHPDYLFGKLNLANEYYLKKEYPKIAEVLGEEMELQALYPDRDTFHLDEVIGFYKFAVLYFLGIGELKQAEMRFDILEEVDADDLEFVEHQLFATRLKFASQVFEEAQKNKISVETRPEELKSNSKAPQFNHKEIEWLYTNGLYMGEEKLNHILSLPKDTLVQDLERVLQDSIDRYAYFEELFVDNGWEEETSCFVVHAIFLLGELQAEESLEAVFKTLSQSEDYIDLYFGDFITVLWEPLYKIAFNTLEDCKQFMFQPGVYTHSRCNIIDMVEQIALHHPERRSEVLDWFADVIQFYLNSSLEDNVIDSDLIGLMLWSLSDIKTTELLPEIEKLYESGLVSEGICGDWEEIKEAFKEPEKHNKQREILSIADRYQQITSTWAGYTEDEDVSELGDGNFLEDLGYFDDDFEPTETFIKPEPKIGRNELCPCGSGKKYKKCCLLK